MRVYSIFSSVQGEVNYMGQGTWATFIRLAGCNLRCSYCDTKYAWEDGSGREKSVYEILLNLDIIGIKNVMITGGEPLHQNLDSLIQALYSNKYQIVIETNGSISPFALDKYMHKAIQCWVVDYKLPSSETTGQWSEDWDGFLTHKDYIKFVMSTAKDYVYARDKVKSVKDHHKYFNQSPRMAFSPVAGKLSVEQLMEWMRKDKLFDVQINVQLHKICIPNEPG